MEEVKRRVIELQTKVTGAPELKRTETSLLRIEKATTAANKQLRKFGGPGGAVNQVAKSGKRLNGVIQNTSYQLQDLIIQIQGGQDPIRALSQQLPQMFVGFKGIGIAIAGLTAALLPTLISQFSDAADESEDLADSLMELDDVVSNIGRTFNTLDLTKYAEEFLKADRAQQQFMRTTLEYQKAIASLSAANITGGLTAIPERSPGTGGRSGRTAFNARYDDAAESLGLYSEQLKTVEEQYNTVVNAETRSAESIQTLNQSLREIALTGEIRNENLRQTIEQFNRLEQAYRTIESADQAFTDGIEKAKEQLQEITVSVKELDRAMVELESTQDDLNLGFDTGIFAREQESDMFRSMQEMIEGTEDWSLAEQAVTSFGEGFETMTDAVIRGTTSIEDGVKNMVKVLILEIGKLAAYKLIASFFGPGTAIGDAAGSLLPSAKGNVFQGGDVKAFARGGIVNGPTLFPMARGAGLMGEAGPEAIMPLGRNARGELGVKGGGMNVVINNNAPGVDVRPRQTDGGLTLDVVLANVAASIDRGGNPISNSLERNYTLGRGGGVY